MGNPFLLHMPTYLKILFVFILTPFRYTRAHAQVLHAQRSQ